MRLRSLPWAAIVVAYLALRAPLLAVPLERDEGAFATVGAAILRGEVPYRDVFDHKPPGAFYAYAAGLALVPHSAVGVHLFLLAWNLGTLLCLASLARVVAGERAARWSAFAFAVVSIAPAVQGFSAGSEMLLLLPLVASLRLSVAGAAAGRGGLLALAGAAGAFACWIKQPAALPLAASALLLYERCPTRRDLARAAAAWLAGAVAVGTAVAAYFVVAAGAAEFWYWTVEHSRLYAALPVANALARAQAGFANLVRDLPLFVVAAVAGVVWGLRAGRDGARFAAAFLVLSLVSIFHSRFFYLHYFALLAPALALAAGVALAAAQEGLARSRRATRLYVAIVVVLALAPPLAARPWYWLAADRNQVIARLLGPQGADADELVAEHLRAHSAPGDRIFVYGSEPQIGFLSGRRDLNPFVMVYPLTWPWPRHREFQERVWSAVERERPAFIVVSRLRNSLVRSPAVDPFLEERLGELAQRDYRFELAVLGGESGSRLSFDPPDAQSDVIAEVWRRGR